jgi:hypothetical protein
MARSSDRSLLGVVSSLSPSKMLLAPARKHSACWKQVYDVCVLCSVDEPHIGVLIWALYQHPLPSMTTAGRNFLGKGRRDAWFTARAWSAKEKLRRPADSRTTERGMVMRAVAITRASSSPLTGCWPWRIKRAFCRLLKAPC